ncbi:hypothetical protein NDU88_007093 [Pleurodeles waltl]|uniref:Uncharacterized protein n=1 Tax=Pleurodeles waltl TaxID=8319 RepID=A0AAV7TYR4_PLEWA|nr:hypothetical protein NDU88_007093 [Pleurodeles waltl]
MDAAEMCSPPVHKRGEDCRARRAEEQWREESEEALLSGRWRLRSLQAGSLVLAHPGAASGRGETLGCDAGHVSGAMQNWGSHVVLRLSGQVGPPARDCEICLLRLGGGVRQSDWQADWLAAMGGAKGIPLNLLEGLEAPTWGSAGRLEVTGLQAPRASPSCCRWQVWVPLRLNWCDKRLETAPAPVPLESCCKRTSLANKIDTVVTDLTLLHADHRKLADKSRATEHTLYELAPKAPQVDTSVQSLLDWKATLERRVDDSEGHCRRNNIRAVGLLEGVEGSDPVSYVEK